MFCVTRFCVESYAAHFYAVIVTRPPPISLVFAPSSAEKRYGRIRQLFLDVGCGMMMVVGLCVCLYTTVCLLFDFNM